MEDADDDVMISFKVVSQREQVLVVPMTHLEDVRKNITETATAEDNVDELQALTEVQSLVEDDGDGYASSADYKEETSTVSSQRDDSFYRVLTEIPEATRKPTFLDNAPQEIPYLLPNPRQEEEVLPTHPSISVPIIAFLDPTKISDDKIDVPIAAVIPGESTPENRLDLLENGRDKIQDYVDGNSWRMTLGNWRYTLPPSEVCKFGMIA